MTGVTGRGPGLALIVFGHSMLFIVPWVGVPLGVVGLFLIVVYFVRASRPTTCGRP